MNIVTRKNSLLWGPLSGAVYDYPVSINLNIWWNFGSLLGFCLVIQIVSGLSLAMHYVPSADTAFSSVVHIMRDVNHGWLIRSVHSNGASFFFICVYIHIGRGIYYGCYELVGVWVSGVVLLVMLMAIAFMGYVLPWGQMSYWGATVITNMVTVIPYIGKDLLYWIWGGYTIGTPTLLRFYVLHFLMPFLMAIVVVIHMVYLHRSGGSNPLGIDAEGDMIPFHPYYTSQDLLGFSMMSWALAYVCLLHPHLFSQPDNLIPANPLVTPSHIQPEWYFLFAYAILRSIPDKTGGVLALVCSILVLLTLPMSAWGYMGCMSSCINPINQLLFWFFVVNFGLLTWLGTCPVEEPFISAGQLCTGFYFSFFVLYPMIMRLWWRFLNWFAHEGPVKPFIEWGYWWAGVVILLWGRSGPSWSWLDISPVMRCRWAPLSDHGFKMDFEEWKMFEYTRYMKAPLCETGFKKKFSDWEKDIKLARISERNINTVRGVY